MRLIYLPLPPLLVLVAANIALHNSTTVEMAEWSGWVALRSIDAAYTLTVFACGIALGRYIGRSEAADDKADAG